MLKIRIIIATFIVVMLCASCSDPEYREKLVEADEMSSVDPERAMAMLDSMEAEMAAAPEHEQMYYRLLRVKAPDKAYIKHTTDSLILPIVKYYETKGDKRLLTEAYYYAGNTYRDLNDAPMALEYYQKAIDILPKNNSKLRIVLHSQTGRLFLNQNLYSKAIAAFRDGSNECYNLRDTINNIYILRDLAYTYNKIQRKDSCLYYYNKAYLLAREINNTHLCVGVLGQMASFYIDNGDLAKAKECLSPALNERRDINKSPNYCMALKIYMGTNQYDSAYYYGNELLTIGTIYAKQTASMYLTELYLMDKDYGNAIKSLKLFNEYTDSVKRITATETVNRINSLYNYNLRERENMMLKAKNSRNVSIIVVITAVCCVVISVFIVYIHRNRQKQRLQAENMKQLKNKLFEQSEEYIQKNNEKIGILEYELNKVSEENKMLIERLEEQRTDLILANEAAIRKKARNEAARVRLFATDIYNTINEYIIRKKIITDSEWTEVDRVVNQEIENFRVNLYSYYNISLHEYHICLLIRMGIQPKDMANLLGCTTSAVSKARKRLQEKFFGDSGSSKDFDVFVNSL